MTGWSGVGIDPLTKILRTPLPRKKKVGAHERESDEKVTSACLAVGLLFEAFLADTPVRSIGVLTASSVRAAHLTAALPALVHVYTHTRRTGSLTHLAELGHWVMTH